MCSLRSHSHTIRQDGVQKMMLRNNTVKDETTVDFGAYIDQCAAESCSYTYNGPNDAGTVITQVMAQVRQSGVWSLGHSSPSVYSCAHHGRPSVCVCVGVTGVILNVFFRLKSLCCCANLLIPFADSWLFPPVCSRSDHRDCAVWVCGQAHAQEEGEKVSLSVSRSPQTV